MAEEQIFQQQIFNSTEKSFDFSGLLKAINQQQFEQFLQFLAEKNHLESLNISNNQLSDEKFLRILDVVYAKHDLKILDASFNNITDYAIQKIVSKLLLQNMLSHQNSAQLQILKLVGNPISQIAMHHLSGVTWIRKELKIYVLEAYLAYAQIEPNKTREIFSDGTIFLDSEIAYQKAKNIEQHREIFLVKAQIPVHVIDYEHEKDILDQTSLTISPQFKADLLIESKINLLEPTITFKVTHKVNDFSEKFIFKKQNCRIALEYLFRSVKHLENILLDRLNQIDITKDGKQYLLIQFLLGKHETKQQDVLNVYFIKLKISELKQKQIFKEDLIEVSQNLFEISNYLKKSMENADLLLKEFHDFIENILDNLFVRSDTDSQKQKQLKIGVFAR